MRFKRAPAVVSTAVGYQNIIAFVYLNEITLIDIYWSLAQGFIDLSPSSNLFEKRELYTLELNWRLRAHFPISSITFMDEEANDIARRVLRYLLSTYIIYV